MELQLTGPRALEPDPIPWILSVPNIPHVGSQNPDCPISGSLFVFVNQAPEDLARFRVNGIPPLRWVTA